MCVTLKAAKSISRINTLFRKIKKYQATQKPRKSFENTLAYVWRLWAICRHFEKAASYGGSTGRCNTCVADSGALTTVLVDRL